VSSGYSGVNLNLIFGSASVDWSFLSNLFNGVISNSGGSLGFTIQTSGLFGGTVAGTAGNNLIFGGFGADLIGGGAGDDTLIGGPLGDMLYGGDGNDYLNGGYGHDRMAGGAGADTFYHLGIASHGSDWIQDYSGTERDKLLFGAAATRADFQVNYAETPNAGTAGVQEAFVIYKPTGQIIWALVDGGAQDHIYLQIGNTTYDLMS
jgi:Ca2+-binding RTX toxin-like protein